MAPASAPSPALPAPALAVERRDVGTKTARVRLAYAGSGAPTVLIHDVLQSHLAWTDVMGPLAERLQVVALDLPGAGESEKPPLARFAYDFRAFGEVVADVVAALGLGRVSLVGHGLGAAVALACAAAHPALVDKLVLVAPSVYEHARVAPLDRLAKVPLFGPMALKQLVGLSEFRRYFATTCTPTTRPSRLASSKRTSNASAPRPAVRPRTQRCARRATSGASSRSSRACDRRPSS
ncbi:MAG: alpha/beta fold hydrolase [Polyangiaceae bacterium]